MTQATRILSPGRNCWRLARADRMAVLVDAEAYFRAFVEAAEQARHSLIIVGWDIDSRTRLLRDDDGLRLGAFLERLVRKRGSLQIYILAWDFAMLFALEREFLPVFKLGWRTHHRIHFRLDDRHPSFGSHHQKLVVVDDRVAFLGGLDLCTRRWDTPEHEASDARRVDPEGRRYRPFHDLQCVVSGEAARALGELARQRWEWSGAAAIGAPDASADSDPWPERVEPQWRDLEVGLARTLPAYEEREQVCEVEHLYHDSIAAAERLILVENQYLTAHRVREQLAERLGGTDGPELFMISSQRAEGWLEEQTMAALRAQWLQRLEQADTHQRFSAWAPLSDDSSWVKIHSKLCIIDDRFLRIGSANLSNRSMGLDSELDLALELAQPDSQIRELRRRLLAEHLGVEPSRLEAAERRHGTLRELTEETFEGQRQRRLVRLHSQDEPSLLELIPAEELADPERPIEAERLLEQLLPRELEAGIWSRLWRPLALLALLLALAAGWRYTPLGELVEPQQLVASLGALAEQPAALPLAVVGFVVASVLMVPVTLLVLSMALLFGPWLGALGSLLGCMAAAGCSYELGRLAGRDLVRRLGGKRLNSLSRRLARHGVLAVAVVRNLPVAPFTLVNLVAGASHVSLRDYLLGTALGMAPGVLALSLLGDRLLAVLRDPGPGTLALLALALVLAALLFVAARRWSRRRAAPED